MANRTARKLSGLMRSSRLLVNGKLEPHAAATASRPKSASRTGGFDRPDGPEVDTAVDVSRSRRLSKVRLPSTAVRNNATQERLRAGAGPVRATRGRTYSVSSAEWRLCVGPEEDAAFSRYVTARRDHVRRTAYLLCGDWHRADDLTQIAFVKLYGAWDRVRDPLALDAYVRSCLVRATIDESRRPWRRERSVEILP